MALNIYMTMQKLHTIPTFFRTFWGDRVTHILEDISDSARPGRTIRTLTVGSARVYFALHSYTYDNKLKQHQKQRNKKNCFKATRQL